MKKNCIISCLFLFSGLSVQAYAEDDLSFIPGNYFTVEAKIIIYASKKKTYEMAANTVNDHIWRSEVHQISADGDFEIGTRYIEDAELGIHRHYYTEVELIDKSYPDFAIYQTVEENKFFLKSYRLFRNISAWETEFIYKVEIEKAMIKDIMGAMFPVSLIRPIYEQRMRKYLKSLKRKLEVNKAKNLTQSFN